MKIMSLGYLRIESPNAKEWATFGPDVLGMALSDDGGDGLSDSVSLTNDDRPGRLVISAGEQDRLRCVGWELPNAEELEHAAEQLDQGRRRGTAGNRRAAPRSPGTGPDQLHRLVRLHP